MCHENSSSTRRFCTTMFWAQGVGRAWVSGHVRRNYLSASRRGSITDPNAAHCLRARASMSIATRVPIEILYGRRCGRRQRDPASLRIPAGAATCASAQRPRGAAAGVAAWRMLRIFLGCPRGAGAEAAHRAPRGAATARGADVRPPAALVAGHRKGPWVVDQTSSIPDLTHMGLAAIRADDPLRQDIGLRHTLASHGC